MNKLEDKEIVRLCVEEVGNKMGYADYPTVSQRDYEHLCRIIEEKTGILISLSTMKRIFAGKFERLPQIATLNALTLFMGYGGWQDFKVKKLLEQAPPPVSFNQPPAGQVVHPRSKKTTHRFFLKATGLCLVVGIVLSTFLLSTKQKETVNPGTIAEDIHFSAKKAVAQGVPNSVVFSYDIDHVAGDSFFIQQSWDSRRRVPIRKNRYTQTDIYYEPGYHKAKLIGNGRILKELVVSIPTHDWMAYSKTPAESFPQYFKNPIIHEHRLGVTLKDLETNAIDAEKDRDLYYSFFPPVLDVNSDHFRLKARIRMRTIKPTRCPGIFVSVYCENAMLYFNTTIPGCISEANAMFSDKYLNGKTSDLSGFGQDVLSWQDIEIQVANRRVKILMREKQVFEEQYVQPAGLIKGIGFVSNGLCEVDWVEIRDSSGKAVYRNDFNEQE